MTVAAQSKDDTSMLSLYRLLLQLSRRKAALQIGSYNTLQVEENLLICSRAHGGRRFVVALSFSDHPTEITHRGEKIISAVASGATSMTRPAANEGRIWWKKASLARRPL